MKDDEKKQQELPTEPFDDSHMPEFKPYISNALGIEEEEEIDEDLDYNDFLRY